MRPTILALWLCVFTFDCRVSVAQPPILDGLLVRLDASELADLSAGDTIAKWKNLGVGINDFLQTDPQAQPQIVKVGSATIVRFDGEHDHLRSLHNDRNDVRDLSVFMVAASHANVGDFRGFVAANAPGQRDYESGFNIDLGPGPTRQLEFINIEGRGFGGAADLLEQSYDFGTVHVFTTKIDSDQKFVSLRVDGKETGQRKYQPASIALNELTLGARFYTNGPGDQVVRGHLKCDLAELLIYDRTLSDAETVAVEAYLSAKFKTLADELPRTLNLDSPSAVLVKAENPPAIQMLMPGFEVHELPVQLTNVNNVRFRADGKLVTLGYNGDVHLLSDTDGDGREDEAKLFWKNEGSLRGPIGMLVTPENYPHGQGIFTPSKGKLSLIVDKDGDDQANEEIIVATGWNEISQNVDATGIAMDEAGYLYFGLGTANYANAYLINDQGQAEYDIQSDRGTVQRVSPDFKTRETICTGIRFPIAFAFNEHKDLFCAEQEGATWLANGNPFDELLHIVPDRHYGFPPRHPRHNPDVIDEPSVFDYSPQHQSTCGMVFNAPVNGGPVFGPASWANNAIVCGESRGKIWRTQLSKTDSGYVASTQLLACLQLLTVDACVAPNGDLVVACHSGPPDWGTGPTGTGKLFRIRMSKPEIARPVLAWPSSQHEIQIAFDQPLDPTLLQGVADKIVIQYGEYVRAGDAFETLVPPYAVVQQQLMTPRTALAVRGISLSSDRRNVLLQTDPLRANATYAVSLPYELAESAEQTDQAHRQHPVIDVDFALHGVEASLSSPSNPQQQTWTGWLPHVNWQVSDEFTRHSSAHDELRMQLKNGGVLSLRTRLDLTDILRPKVQPGSTLDYAWPPESVTLVARSSGPLTLTSNDTALTAVQGADDVYEVRMVVPADTADRFPLELQVQVTAGVRPDVSIAVVTNEDERLRALPLHRLSLPWSAASTVESMPEASNIAELAGGSWGRGRRVFHSEAASCFKCHAIGGAGPSVGPDLANLVHRDYKSVLRDIQNPSFAINPDFLGQIVLLKDGRVLTGVLQTKHGQLLLGDATGKVTQVDRSEIESIKPADVSIMPKGMDEKLNADQIRDLMTFLLTSPHMPLDSPLEAPPVRTQAEVASVLAGATPLPTDLQDLNIVLVAGKKDHGPGEHDYPAWQLQWSQLLAAADRVQVDTADEFPSEEQLIAADVLIFFQKGAWDYHRQAKMDPFFARGGGAVYIHWAVNGDERVSDFAQRIGLASRGGNISYRHGPLSLQVHNTDHPIMRNIEPLQLYDESYWRLTGETQAVTLLASSVEDGAPQPQIWCYERSAGRAFVSIPGHYSWTFDDPIFRTILLRGIAWSAKQPIDRFNDLVRPGARMSR